ncbi:MAG TPA: sigma-70 family RNA polymerase sigma factor [Pyrinomonadaceae bacterium]|nr:sigma-70 family RNA polymerase sigma factor [Pyrinomonadaceae bacterium]
MQRSEEVAPGHVDLFIERYERLFLWSLQLTENDQEQAEDLLHDAFIQFTLGQPDLSKIENLEGYLRTMLRNIHVSQVRRSTRSPIRSLSIVEYDSAELGLRVVDPRTQMNFHDELRTVCEYACARKEFSKAGSILILRFFHGYYPEEISKVSRISRPAVKERLRAARAEAKLYLENPKGVHFLRSSQTGLPEPVQARAGEPSVISGDFLGDIRRMIFSSRRGLCLAKDELQNLYRLEEAIVDCEQLAHIVSCAQCLDSVNALLNLPSLSSRYPVEAAGRDSRRKRGGPDGRGPRGGAGMKSVSGYLRRAKEVFEHEPQELFISVNGHILGSQRISSELMEQTLNVKGEEKIGFVEVFSEQEIRLLLLNVESLPDGPVRQSASVRLGNGRLLDLSLSFSGAWPTLHVVYQDPGLAQVQPENIEEDNASPSSSLTEAKSNSPTIDASIKDYTGQLRRRLMNWTFWLRPGTVTALAALILIGTLLFVHLKRVPSLPISASSLLSQSAAAEETIAGMADQVLHRTLNLEERRSTGELLARRKIEVWQSAARGISARRLYNEQGQLIAGDWRRLDGVQTLYQHGLRPKLQLSPDKRAISAAGLGFDNVWQLSPSAKEFTSLVGRVDLAQIEEQPEFFVISYAKAAIDSPGLIKATIVLSRPELHAVRQSLTVQQGNEVRQYEFAEAGYELRAPATVPPSAFEPDDELIGASIDKRESTPPETLEGSSAKTAPNSSAASTDLEVEVTYLLDQVRANLGEQISLTRTSDGRLHVQGIVDTDSRRAEILRSLAPVISNAAVRFEVQTVEEAVRRQKLKSSDSAVAGTLKATEGTELPIESELRRYFAAGGLSGERLDEKVREFSTRMIARSRQAMRHAFALKHLIAQFNGDQIRALSPESRVKRLSMISNHAAAFGQEMRQIRQELKAVFGSSAASTSEEDVRPEIKSEADLAREVQRLFESGSNCDKAIGSTFAISSGTSVTSAIQQPQFWQSLQSAERSAAWIVDVPRALGSSNR